MKLKNKIAKTLRKWVERLDPLIPYNINYAPQHLLSYDIEKIMSKHSIPRYLYEQNPNRINSLARADIITGISKELESRNLVKITIEPSLDRVDYIGEVAIIDLK